MQGTVMQMHTLSHTHAMQPGSYARECREGTVLCSWDTEDTFDGALRAH